MHTKAEADNQKLEKIEQYQQKLTDIQKFIGTNKSELISGEISEEFKQMLLDMIIQTTFVLEEYY